MYHSYQLKRGGAGGSGVVGYLIIWHNWRSTLLVAVVFGTRLPDFLTEAYFGNGVGGGGLGWGGENVLLPCVYICIIISFNAGL